MVGNNDETRINKPSFIDAYWKIEHLENDKERLINQYSLKYDISASNLKEIVVEGGKKLTDSLLSKVIKSDELLDELIKTLKDIMIWTDYFNREIETYLKKGDDTPIIVFLKEHKDLKLKRYLTFIEISDKVYSTEPTVKRKYYDYKNSLNEVVKFK